MILREANCEPLHLSAMGDSNDLGVRGDLLFLFCSKKVAPFYTSRILSRVTLIGKRRQTLLAVETKRA